MTALIEALESVMHTILWALGNMCIAPVMACSSASVDDEGPWIGHPIDPRSG